MNVLTNPNFDDATGWAYIGGSYWVSSGGGAAFCGFRTGSFADPQVFQLGFPLTLGVTYSVGVWVATQGASHSTLTAKLDSGDGVFVEIGSRSDTVAAYEYWNLGSHTALGTSGGIRFFCDSTTHLHGWGLDDARVDSAMAIKLAERAIDAVVTLLLANLETELIAIAAERGDSLTLTPPAAGDYWKYPKPNIVGARAQIEVFESQFNLTKPHQDVSDAKATFTVPITVRVTVFNQAGESAETMAIRLRRYAAGIFIVFNKNPTLGGGDDALKLALVQTVAPQWDIDGEDSDKHAKCRASIGVTVACEELQ